MAGLIRDDDIALVRERARIDEVVSGYVTLKHAGGGSQKGLCPFHDEKSPSFNVNPSKNFFHCFGCGEGGDVIAFLMKIDGLSFAEAVERLADKYGVQLRYQEGTDGRPVKREANLRPRMLEAHKVAQAYYAEQLATPDAKQAREFLTSRGFDKDAADKFGVGFAPRGGEELFKYLRQKGFDDAELVTGGLVGQGQRGHYDRFRGRLLWPIRETNGDTIGFGARRIFDDDRIDAKYLNTSETPIYKKSHVLYGIDLARRDIARASQAVVVEGYTDVMACHLSGVNTAVATCGTAFGDDHGRVLRRLLQDHDEFRGEVIFTFDGDSAGQKAALRAFEGDQNFAGQTYVAVEPGGLDPCDLRLQHGDAAVRELVARRIPLYRFVLSNVVRRYDLDRADGRIDALREAAKLVSAIRDRSKVEGFSRELAGMVGVDVEQARSEVKRAVARGPEQQRTRPEDRRAAEQAQAAEPQRPAAAPAPGPAGPALLPGARDAQARRTASRSGGPDGQGRRRRRLHPPDLPRRVGRRHRPRRTVERARRRRLGGQAPRQRHRPGRRPGAVRAGRRAAAVQQGADDGVRRRARLPPPGDHRDAPDRGPQVPAPADQPGRARDGVQPDVRRARRARAAPPDPAREGHRRRAVRAPFQRAAPVPADVVARAGLGRGDKVLAHTGAADGTWLLGTRSGLVVVPPPPLSELVETIRWEQVETADWNRDEDRLRIAEVGEFGQPRPDPRVHPGGPRQAAAADPRTGHRQRAAAAAGHPARVPVRPHRGRPPVAAPGRRDRLGGGVRRRGGSRGSRRRGRPRRPVCAPPRTRSGRFSVADEDLLASVAHDPL